MSVKCKDCEHSEFFLTSNGRVRSNLAGECKYKIVMPAVPIAVKNYYGYREVFGRISIWANDSHDCPCFSKKHKGINR